MFATVQEGTWEPSVHLCLPNSSRGKCNSAARTAALCTNPGTLLRRDLWFAGTDVTGRAGTGAAGGQVPGAGSGPPFPGPPGRGRRYFGGAAVVLKLASLSCVLHGTIEAQGPQAAPSCVLIYCVGIASMRPGSFRDMLTAIAAALVHTVGQCGPEIRWLCVTPAGGEDLQRADIAVRAAGHRVPGVCGHGRCAAGAAPAGGRRRAHRDRGGHCLEGAPSESALSQPGYFCSVRHLSATAM